MEEYVARTMTPRSLFAKLLTGFLVIIFLLVTFNFISSIYLKNKIYDEIVKYNELSINHTVDAYENHFRLIKNMIVSLNQNDRWTSSLNILRYVKANNGYGSIEEVNSELKPLYTNPFLLFENLFVHFKNDSYVLEKDGTSSTQDMFSKYYYSPTYPVEFWKQQFNEHTNFRIFPAAAFTEKTMGTETKKGVLFPIFIKTMPYDDMYFIVMVDAQKLYKAHHISIDQSFYILDPDGNPIYTSTLDLKTATWPTLETTKTIIKQGDHYFFFKKGTETGLTYVSVVPTESISFQLLKLNMILISLLVATVIICIVISVMFSNNLNKPVRKIIESIKEWDSGSEPPQTSQIREFDLISRKMNSMLKMNQYITEDLNKKTSLLRNYAFTNKIKNIHMNLAEMRDLADTHTPFLFVIFQITYKEQFLELNIDKEKRTYYIREYIDSILLQTYKESVTFQIEQDQVLSLIFLPDLASGIINILEAYKASFEVDQHLYLVTIAVSSVYPASSDFTLAYEEISDMLNQRKLRDEIQLIQVRERNREHFQFTVLQEEEFHTRLMSGSEEAMDSWILRCLVEMDKKNCSVEDYRQFAKDVAIQLEKSLLKLNVNAPRSGKSRSSFEPLRNFYCTEQYEMWFRNLLFPAIQLVQQKTEENSPVTRFVIDYLEHHLHEDITLDLMADKLNITSGYLSTYFKEKTGMNFSDFLNDLRIQRAKELLQHMEHKIQDVATMIGYNNVNSFIRMFKRYSGITPGEYRKKYASQSTVD